MVEIALRISGEQYLREARALIYTTEPITFGTSINVLLITDRLQEYAEGLKEYFEHSTNITVDLVNNYDEAKHVILEKPIDFLIMVGHLANVRNYGVMDICKCVNKYSGIVLFTSIDDFIRTLCEKYGIEDIYDKTMSIEGIRYYLEWLYMGGVEKLIRDYKKEKGYDDLIDMFNNPPDNGLDFLNKISEAVKPIREQLRKEALEEIRRDTNI